VTLGDPTGDWPSMNLKDTKIKSEQLVRLACPVEFPLWSFVGRRKRFLPPPQKAPGYGSRFFEVADAIRTGHPNGYRAAKVGQGSVGEPENEGINYGL